MNDFVNIYKWLNYDAKGVFYFSNECDILNFGQDLVKKLPKEGEKYPFLPSISSYIREKQENVESLCWREFQKVIKGKGG